MDFKKKPRNIRRKEPLPRRLSRLLKSRGSVRILKAGVCLVFALLIIFGSLHIYHELLKSPYLAIKEINVGGNMRVSRAEILELAGVNIGDNLLEINSADIKKGIRVNPWVSEVNVARNFPDRLNIEIKERRPVAFINLDGLYLVDENGTIFKKTSMGDDIDLPIITGLTRADIEAGGKTSELAIKAINLIHLLSKNGIFTHEELSEINVDKTYGLTLYTMEQGTRIELGDDGFTEKIARLLRIIQTRNGLADVEFIGLNYNRGVVVRLALKLTRFKQERPLWSPAAQEGTSPSPTGNKGGDKREWQKRTI